MSQNSYKSYQELRSGANHCTGETTRSWTSQRLRCAYKSRHASELFTNSRRDAGGGIPDAYLLFAEGGMWEDKVRTQSDFSRGSVAPELKEQSLRSSNMLRHDVQANNGFPPFAKIKNDQSTGVILDTRTSLYIILDISQVIINNIIYLEPIKNNVLEKGKFIRFIYSDANMALNALYLNIKIFHKEGSGSMESECNSISCEDTGMQHISEKRESASLDAATHRFGLCPDVGGQPNRSLYPRLDGGAKLRSQISEGTEMQSINTSGWVPETTQTSSFRDIPSNTSECMLIKVSPDVNKAFINDMRTLEEEILTHYLEHMGCEKTKCIWFALTNYLQKGFIKIQNVKSRKPSHIRSNLGGLVPDALRLLADDLPGAKDPNVSKHQERVTRFILARESRTDFMFGVPSNMAEVRSSGVILKISGIWETDTNVGLTFKFINI